MKVSKNIKLKLFVLVAFILLMFVQVGPYLLYADENELTFSYRRIELVATNEYYNSNRLFFSEAYVGQNIAYCLDYGVPLPVSSGGTVKFVRQLNGITTAALIYGYPNVSAASLGVNSDEEAMLATMSMDERMKLYKEKFASTSKTAAASTKQDGGKQAAGKQAGAKGKKASGKGKKSYKDSSRKQYSAKNEYSGKNRPQGKPSSAKEASGKKRGIFGRIKSLFSKK